MAINLRQTIAISLGNLVSDSISSARTEKAKQTAKIEADFNTIVAEGNMSYDDRIKFRQQQLQEEKNSSFFDQDVIDSINTSIGDLKKTKRYSAYRMKYKQVFADENAGRITADQQLTMLKDQLASTTEPDLREELQGYIISAETELKNSENRIFQNRVTLALTDKTIPILQDAIDKVTSKRAMASLKGNEEEVGAYDINLQDLKAQLNQTHIDNDLIDAQVQSLSKGYGATQKLDTLNQKIASADSNTPIRIENKPYASAKEYWTLTRDAYLSGSGTGIFSNFLGEVQKYAIDKADTDVNRFGNVIQPTLDSINNQFEQLKQKPEMQPFLEQINNLQTSTIKNTLDYNATALFNRASLPPDNKLYANPKDTINLLQNYSQKYGVNYDNFIAGLTNLIPQETNTNIPGGSNIPTDKNIPTTTGEKPIVPGADNPVVTPNQYKNPLTPSIPGEKPVVPGTETSPTPQLSLQDQLKQSEDVLKQAKEHFESIKTEAAKYNPKLDFSAAQTPADIFKIATGQIPPELNAELQAAESVKIEAQQKSNTLKRQISLQVNKEFFVNSAKSVMNWFQSGKKLPTSEVNKIDWNKNPILEKLNQPFNNQQKVVNPPVNKPVVTSPTVVPKTYNVASGDTLGRIAIRNNTTVNNLLNLNPQYKTNPNLIKVGESIKLS